MEGQSWVNLEEVHAVLNLVQNYYQKEKIAIITPYDAQRAALVERLEARNFPSDNVDNVEGHEAPFVIISTVRTDAAGFLELLNVMLTRFKCGMVVDANRNFFRRPERGTLLGRLARHWEDKRGGTITSTWTDARTLADRVVDMPGVAVRLPETVPLTLSVQGHAVPRPAISGGPSRPSGIVCVFVGTATAARAPQAPGAAIISTQGENASGGRWGTGSRAQQHGRLRWVPRSGEVFPAFVDKPGKV
ncbi:hypothetical protein B0H21DRAFT_824441 [Amylocystis lapponica]|nr:hypothetical protein B0H21DRAFT_824441 [Amylocystis lapponica]